MSISAPFFVGLKSSLLRISDRETSFRRRGFEATGSTAQEHLESAGRAFVAGYNQAVASTDFDQLSRALNSHAIAYRGFVFEGAAMGLALLDQLALREGRRWHAFLAGSGNDHTYMVHVGAGWAVARIPWLRWRLERYLREFDPLLRWLVVDGYGFHEGFFHWPRSVRRGAVPKGLVGYARRAFDQGLGRSLWFICGCRVEQIAATIHRFQSSRRADLWGGIGLACGYAGGVEAADLRVLRDMAGDYRPQVGQGVAFAAKARQRAGNPVSHTELAAEIICDQSLEEAAALTDACLRDLPDDAEFPAYEHWRRRIRERLSSRCRV